MRRLTKFTVFLFMVGLILNPPVSGQAVVRDPAWEFYVSSQKKNQNAFHDLVKEDMPIAGNLIDESCRMQLDTVEQKSTQYYYLFKNYPNRIVRDYGFFAFINFVWTEADEQYLLKENKEYRERQKQIKKIADSLNKNADFQAVIERFAALSGSEKYLELEKDFLETPYQVEKILQGQVKDLIYVEPRKE